MVWAVVSVVGLVLETSVIVALGLSATGADAEPADDEARGRTVERARPPRPVTAASGAPGAEAGGRVRPGGW